MKNKLFIKAHNKKSDTKTRRQQKKQILNQTQVQEPKKVQKHLQ